MLTELKVRSLGIIDELEWSPRKGLNVISGETGAGKSLVASALKALIDGRLEETAIRHGAELARIEGVFCFAPVELPALTDLLTDRGVPLDEDGLVMSGEFRRQGRAVFRLNGNAVPRVVVREAGQFLVDAHSQSEHLALFDRRNHLDYLDIYGNSTVVRERFATLAGELARLVGLLADLDRGQEESAHHTEILNYQTEEIKRARLSEGEEEALTQERQVLTASEKLKALAHGVSQALAGEDMAALTRMHQAREDLRRLVAVDPSLKDSLSLLEDAYINLQELARDVRGYGEGLEFDPGRLDEIDNRLELLRNLKKKYGGTINAVINYLERAEQELTEMFSSGENRATLEEKIRETRGQLGLVGEELSRTRAQAACKLSVAVKQELGDIGLSQVDFEIKLARRPDANGIPLSDGVYAYDRTGMDDVEFMVATNPGEPLKPLANIASTGEVSRFTLAIKVALAEADRTPVLVFDEIDIGIGGRSGEVVGQKLWRLARHHQVICITHLPQIAVYGDAHYRVQKESDGARTVTSLREIEGKERLKELAAMLSGAVPVKPATDTASELWEGARQWMVAQAKS